MKPDRKKAPTPSTRPEPAKAVRGKAEESEPSLAHSAMPVWLFIALAILLFWGFVYLDDRAGGFNPQVYGAYKSLADVKSEGPQEPDFVKRGRLTYQGVCLPCHQVNGLGIPGQFPPLAGSEWVLAKDPDRIIRIVHNGLGGPIRVKNIEINQVMLPVGAGMTDEQIADVLSFVRQEWGNKAPPVTPQKVGEVRKQIGDRVASWTAEELLKIQISE